MDGPKLCCWCAEGETRAQFVASSRFPANQETPLSDPRARGEGKEVSRRLRGRRGAVRFPGCVSPPGGYQRGAEAQRKTNEKARAAERRKRTLG